MHGAYLHPPENAVVVCVGEKSQSQAVERSQPILAMRPGIPGRQTHDYARHGVTCLFTLHFTPAGCSWLNLVNDHRHPFAWTKDARRDSSQHQASDG